MLGSSERTYNEILMEARALYLSQLLPDATAAMYHEYALMLERIMQEMEQGTITPERARGLLSSILGELDRLSIRLASVGDGAMLEASQLSVEAHREAVQTVTALQGVTVDVSFTEVPFRVIEMMYQRRQLGGAANFKALIDRRLVGVAGEVDRYLSSAVARGVSGKRGAQELAKILSGGDPALSQALNALGPRGRRTREAIAAGTEIPPETMKQAQALLKDSYRIMVTETNQANDFADKVASAASPVVDLLKWEVSGRHYSLPSSPDICSIYHKANFTGYGEGLWHPESVPPLPHPFCACHTSKILRPVSDWGKPKRPLPTPGELSEAEATAIMEAVAATHRGRPRKLTSAFISYQTRLANELVKQSDLYARRLQTQEV